MMNASSGEKIDDVVQILEAISDTDQPVLVVIVLLHGETRRRGGATHKELRPHLDAASYCMHGGAHVDITNPLAAVLKKPRRRAF